MDIIAKIEEIVEKVKSDKEFANKFKDDPVKAIESIVGIDLPDEQINALVEGVKANVNLDKLDGVMGKFKKLF